MPELSNYKPKPPIYRGRPDDRLYMGDLEVPEDIQARMRQRYQDALGFADPSRIGPDMLVHGLMEAVPRENYDQQIQMVDPDGGTSDAMTFRQIMDILNKMRPNEQQGP